MIKRKNRLTGNISQQQKQSPNRPVQNANASQFVETRRTWGPRRACRLPPAARPRSSGRPEREEKCRTGRTAGPDRTDGCASENALVCALGDVPFCAPEDEPFCTLGDAPFCAPGDAPFCAPSDAPCALGLNAQAQGTCTYRLEARVARFYAARPALSDSRTSERLLAFVARSSPIGIIFNETGGIA